MASFPLDLSKPLASDLYGAVNAAKAAIRGIKDHQSAIIQMLDGANENTAASYASITPRYGTASDAKTMAMFLEVASCVGAATAAIEQLAAKIK